jgi:hypothetical protein
MKTYFFIIGLFLSIAGQTFAAQDDSFVQMSTMNPVFYSLTLNQLETTDKQSINAISWKEKVAFKILKKQIIKAERNGKKGKKAHFFGGLLALLIIGAILIPIGIIFLLPLIIVGVILLAFGILGSTFRGIGRAIWW